MNSLQFYTQGSNRWLLVALAVWLVGFAVVSLGPARAYSASLREELVQRENELDRVEGQIRGFEPIARDTLDAWAAELDALRLWLAPPGDAADQLVQVAQMFEGPTTRGLQVQPGPPLEGRALALDLEPETTLTDPTSDATLAIRAVPLSVRFRAGYPALVAALARLEEGETPALCESLTIKREIDALRVELDIVLLVRGEPTP